ncbi:GH39 family glycosyl hydrolase [Streptomyces sp. 6N223]|uniref:GH39 family glycosyl hydrolase n=1 Tax=Streptomyces sp. 6N223 TaxID=3457412 RepID=UPI003FD4B451
MRNPRTSHRKRGLGSLAAALAAATAALLLIPAGSAQPAQPPAQTLDDSVSVDFSADLGAPKHHASGILYGITEDGSNPPDEFFTGIDFRFERAGGAQLGSPGGWVAGDYERRWNSTLAQYQRTVDLGGTFQMLPHDLWGADGTTSPRFPGDNGDWSDYDAFLDQLISDIKAAGINPQWDIWNEPDITQFWDRSQEQYLEMWDRTYARIREELPDTVIVGPSTAGEPDPGNGWWTTFLDHVAEAGTVPDIISWHEIGGSPNNQDPAASKASVQQMLADRGLTVEDYSVNEYAWPEQQNPGNSGWFIARLEHGNVDGLRANWASGNALHDNMASLLTNDGGTYQPLGDWQLYKFYAEMTGTRAEVTPGADLDGYATGDDEASRAAVLLGTKGSTGTMTVDLTGLDAVTGLVQNGTVRAVVERVPWNNGGVVTGLEPVADEELTVDGNSATVTIPWTDFHDAYTITLLPPDAP